MESPSLSLRRGLPRLGLSLTVLMLTACAAVPEPPESAAPPPSHHAHEHAVDKSARRSTVDLHMSAAFGPDGKLWRVRTDGQYLYVDASSDLGEHFGEAVTVNSTAQTLHANGENRPQIAVDSQGRIWVAYSADAVQPWTVFISQADAGGAHFSAPVPLSDQASAFRTFLPKLIIDGKDHAHFFWHVSIHALEGANLEEIIPLPNKFYPPEVGGFKPARNLDERRDHLSNRHTHIASLFHAEASAPALTTPSSDRVTRSVCECCRIAVAIDSDGLPVLFNRTVFPVNERDHGLAKITSDGRGWKTWRVTDDNWEMDACPEHGPAFAIDSSGRYHMAWFSQGKKRQGLFYAWSADRGKHLSAILSIGNKKAEAGHPALFAQGQRVVLAWREFDGRRNYIKAMQSYDGGEHWDATRTVAQAKGAADFPQLISDGSRIYLSWSSREQGYRLIAVE